MPLRERIETIAKEVYGADGVDYTPEAQAKAKKIEADPEFSKLGTCMVKTHLSLSHDPTLKGVPKGWTLPIRDILIYRGRGVRRSRWRATSSSCPAPPPTRPSAAWTWTSRPAK